MPTQPEGSPTIFSFRRQLGHSFWLWSFLFSRLPVSVLVLDVPYWTVPGEFNDVEIGGQLCATAATIRKWRERLERMNLIRTSVLDNGKQRIEFLNLQYRPEERNSAPRPMVN
jgi:hypothetical protein